MPEPFKEFFNTGMVTAMAGHFQAVHPEFPAKAFVDAATRNFADQELKERSNAIRDALIDALPAEFPRAAQILTAALHPENNDELTLATTDQQGIRGWGIMPMADVVAATGMADFDLSMATLRQMTSRFSAEFAVRPFFAADPDRALAIAADWARDGNYHVRRLASEGSRPRLPWGMRLHCFVADPAPLIPILTALRDDPEEYVRRSVANNLNDIAKDHPDLVAGIAADWRKHAPQPREKLIRHACRSLIKAGHAPTLAALGYGPAKVDLTAFAVTPEVLDFGSALELNAEITSTGTASQDLIIDYVIHHQKADGSTSPKVFKWKIAKVAAGGSLRLTKSHPMRPITTRVYYPGAHRVEVQVNGAVIGGADFMLRMPSA